MRYRLKDGFVIGAAQSTGFTVMLFSVALYSYTYDLLDLDMMMGVLVSFLCYGAGLSIVFGLLFRTFSERRARSMPGLMACIMLAGNVLFTAVTLDLLGPHFENASVLLSRFGGQFTLLAIRMYSWFDGGKMASESSANSKLLLEKKAAADEKIKDIEAKIKLLKEQVCREKCIKLQI